MKKSILILFAFIIGLSQLLFQTGCRSCNGELRPCNLPAPDSLVATPVSSTSVKLDWSLVPSAPNYNVQVFSIGQADSLSLVQTLNNVNPTLLVTGLTPNGFYKAVVRANCPNGTTSINSSDVNFRLPAILIEDVVMIREKDIMKPMSNDLCTGASNSIFTIGIPQIITWGTGQVYCLVISKESEPTKKVEIKIGFKNGNIVQYRKISNATWTSAIGSNKIEIKEGSIVATITFDGSSFTLTNLSSTPINLSTTMY